MRAFPALRDPVLLRKIDSERSSKAGQIITVDARNWSDTATFLIEAEVLHTMPTSAAHEFFPVIFGRELSFTLAGDRRRRDGGGGHRSAESFLPSRAITDFELGKLQRQRESGPHSRLQMRIEAGISVPVSIDSSCVCV